MHLYTHKKSKICPIGRAKRKICPIGRARLDDVAVLIDAVNETVACHYSNMHTCPSCFLVNPLFSLTSKTHHIIAEPGHMHPLCNVFVCIVCIEFHVVQAFWYLPTSQRPQ